MAEIDDHPDKEDRVLRFSRRELIDFAIAWVALSVAFTFFFEGPDVVSRPDYLSALADIAGTIGVAFVAHEAAHKVVAVRFGQAAFFKANYRMLFLAIGGGLAGFIFAIPGAVYHEGALTDREHGLIALAGPVTNLLLAALFVPLLWVSNSLAAFGIGINLLLAAFNMLPFGPLDGATVKRWSLAVHLLVFVPSVWLGIAAGLVLF